MSVRFGTFDKSFRRQIGIPNFNRTYTCMCWIFLEEEHPTVGQQTQAFQVAPAVEIPNFVNESDILRMRKINSTTTVLQLTADHVGPLEFSSFGTTPLVINRWYHLAMVRYNQRALTAYIDGEAEVSIIDDVGTVRQLPSFFILAGHGGTNFKISRLVSAIKVWNQALSRRQIKSEMVRIRPVQFNNLNTFAPVFPGVNERAKDYSRNRYNFQQITGSFLQQRDDDPNDFVDVANQPPIYY